MTGMRATVLRLGDLRATDVAVSGAKGAGLARALAAGFPVLDGVVVSPAASVGALAAGRAVLDTVGSGGARMAIIRSGLDEALLGELAAAVDRLPEPLIVRSSSVLEGRGEWAGAFTSVPEVRRHEVPKAARSVWATCFALEVLDRCEAAGIEPGSAPMGLLVQPEIAPDAGGSAVVDAAGAVTVDVVKGSPRDLMAGWEAGARAVCEQGELAGHDAVELVGRDVLRAVAALALRVRAALGHNLVEWSVLDGDLALLQVGDSAAGRGAPAPVAVPAALGHPFALEVVRLAHRYPGALGEELVLGWLPGMRAPVEPVAVTGGGGREPVLAEARRLAARLVSEAWGEPPERAAARARLVLRRLRSDRPNESLEALRELHPVDPAAAARLLGMHDHLGVTGGAPQRRGVGRWEPVLAGVAVLQGEVVAGQPGVGGLGAGRLVWVDGSQHTAHVRPRDIIVTQYPLQNYSPLLWDAAGVVTLGGAPSAHMFEVARSLTVPAVVGCPVGDVVRRGPVLGMVDGDAGRVALLPR